MQPDITLITEEYSKMSERGINDMVDIDELNPATLLFNMSQMYKRYDIYVYVESFTCAIVFCF